MFKKIKNIFKGFSSKESKIFTFLRAQVTSQMATVVDNVTAFLLKKSLDIFKVKSIDFFFGRLEGYVFSTIVGQILGGFFVCFMNWKWSFKSKTVKFRYILVKFFLVWLGSLSLNTYFTFLLTEWLKENRWLIKLLGANSDDVFIFAKLFVALIVGFFWNYTMYRRFVYKDLAIDKFFQRVFKKK
ncbi:MAG: GtrA family protein [Prevotellaceae bacterium]|jgi:putative flippase GtrA|nr:GtrA family protein [Prevotellaceae bacterium]